MRNLILAFVLFLGVARFSFADVMTTEVFPLAANGPATYTVDYQVFHPNMSVNLDIQSRDALTTFQVVVSEKSYFYGTTTHFKVILSKSNILGTSLFTYELGKDIPDVAGVGARAILPPYVTISIIQLLGNATWGVYVNENDL